MEIERKFLVNKVDFDLSKYNNVDIIQCYISINPEIRIRKINNKFYETHKSSDDLIRFENEYEISKNDFDYKIKFVLGKIIYKKRYYIPIIDKLVAELDIYQDYLCGLKIVEVEFNNIQEAGKFNKLEWFGDEVTFLSKYKNKSLSQIESFELSNI